MQNYKTIIFDLGNVIVSFDARKMCSQIAHLSGLSFEEIKDCIKKVWMGYERGTISSEELFALFNKISKRSLNYSEFMLAGCDIFTLRPEMLDLVKTLKKRGYYLIILSNTNEAHYQFIKKKYGFFNLFDQLILSFEVKMVKPEIKLFELAVQRALCPSQACYYIDDIPQYIEAAKTLGITGHLFTHPSLLLKDLQTYNIL